VKDYESRQIPLSKHTVEILVELQSQARFKGPYILLNEPQHETVRAKWQRFKKQGRPWENRDMVNNVGREFDRHVKKADIRPSGTLSLHTLRKCAGKNWADHLPPNVTKELMGHSSIATTMKYYTQVDDDQRAKAAAVVDQLVRNDAAAKTDAGMTPRGNLAS